MTDEEWDLFINHNKYQEGKSINEICQHPLPYVRNYIVKHGISKDEPLNGQTVKKLNQLHVDNEIALELYYS